MRTPRFRFVASVLALAALTVLAACSSDSKTSASSSASAAAKPDKVAFCQDNADLDKATANVTDPNQLPQAFKDNASKLDDILKHAPAEVKADTEKLVSAAKQVAASGNPSVFLTDQSLQTAGQHLNDFCSSSSTIKSDSTGSSASTSDSSSSTDTTIKSEDSTSSSESTSSST